KWVGLDAGSALRGGGYEVAAPEGGADDWGRGTRMPMVPSGGMLVDFLGGRGDAGGPRSDSAFVSSELSLAAADAAGATGILLAAAGAVFLGNTGGAGSGEMPGDDAEPGFTGGEGSEGNSRVVGAEADFELPAAGGGKLSATVILGPSSSTSVSLVLGVEEDRARRGGAGAGGSGRRDGLSGLLE